MPLGQTGFEGRQKKFHVLKVNVFPGTIYTYSTVFYLGEFFLEMLAVTVTAFSFLRN